MSYLDTQGLNTLWTKIKNTFVNKVDVVQATELSIDSTPTESSTNLVTSGGVYSGISTKSTVTVSASGTATDEVQYITIDGTEKKIAGGGSTAWGSISGTLSNQTDLQTALDSKANSSTTYTKSEVDTALSGKQDNLSQEQLTATNSGITSNKVTTYDGYASTKQDTIDSSHKLPYSLISDTPTIPTLPTGSIQMYGGATAPSGWLLCDGQAVSRTTYAELFNVLGTTYGSGDGSTTFNIPDLRGKVGAGASSTDTDFALGYAGGTKSDSYTPSGSNSGGAVQSHTLTVNEMPYHNHGGYLQITASAIRADGTGKYARMNPGASGTSYCVVINANGSSYGHDHGLTQPTFTGTATTLNKLQPYLTINYIIKAS